VLPNTVEPNTVLPNIVEPSIVLPKIVDKPTSCAGEMKNDTIIAIIEITINPSLILSIL
jgi:hypothetical protein